MSECYCRFPGSNRSCPTHASRTTRFIRWLDDDISGGRWAWAGVSLMIGMMGGALWLGWWTP